MSDHSPGPWHVSKRDGRTIVRLVYDPVTETSREEEIAVVKHKIHGMVANADLIAAAPELKEWKESAMEVFATWDEVGETLGGVKTIDLGISRAEIAMREAKRLKTNNADMLEALENLTEHLADMGLMNEDSEGWQDAIAAIANAKKGPTP